MLKFQRNVYSPDVRIHQTIWDAQKHLFHTLVTLKKKSIENYLKVKERERERESSKEIFSFFDGKEWWLIHDLGNCIIFASINGSSPVFGSCMKQKLCILFNHLAMKSPFHCDDHNKILLFQSRGTVDRVKDCSRCNSMNALTPVLENAHIR